MGNYIQLRAICKEHNIPVKIEGNHIAKVKLCPRCEGRQIVNLEEAKIIGDNIYI